MARLLRRTLAVLALAVVCASCKVDLKIDVAMKADGSGTVIVTAIADAQILQQAPQIATDLRFADLKASGWTVQGPAPTSDGGLQVVLAHSFQTPEQATAILASINGPNGPLVGMGLSRVRAKGTTTFAVNGALQLTGGLDAFTDSDLLTAVGATPYTAQLAAASVQPADAITATFTVSLPGTVKTNNAGRGVGLTWSTPLGATSQAVSASTETHDPKNVWAKPLAKGALIALVAWLVIAFLFIVYVFLARRRRYRQRALR